jgi:hypothetical protein
MRLPLYLNNAYAFHFHRIIPQTLVQHMQSQSAAAATALTAHAALKNSVYDMDQRVGATADLAQSTADAFRAHCVDAADAHASVISEVCW